MCVLHFRLSVSKSLSHQWSHFSCKTIRGSLCGFRRQRTLKETQPQQLSDFLTDTHPAPVRDTGQIHVGVWISGPAFFFFQAPFPQVTPWKDSEQYYPLVNFIYLNLSLLLIPGTRDGNQLPTGTHQIHMASTARMTSLPSHYPSLVSV